MPKEILFLLIIITFFACCKESYKQAKSIKRDNNSLIKEDTSITKSRSYKIEHAYLRLKRALCNRLARIYFFSQSLLKVNKFPKKIIKL
jgi:hypothetical protein